MNNIQSKTKDTFNNVIPIVNPINKCCFVFSIECVEKKYIFIATVNRNRHSSQN